MSARFPRRQRALGVLAAVLALVAVAVPAPAGATASSSVRDWNALAVTALANGPGASTPGAGQTPPVSIIHLAMVQGAVYNAVNAIDGGYQPYHAALTAAPGASIDAAVATSAHDVLVGIVAGLPTFPPSTPPAPATFTDAVRDGIIARLDGNLATSLAGITAGKTAGINVGAAAAAAMLLDRRGDGRYGGFRFTSRFGVGQWRAVPASASDPFAWVAEVRPFMLNSNSQFRSDGPLALTSDAYTTEFNEVKALGAKLNSTRTTAQTNLAWFYSVNPVPMYLTAFRAIAAASDLSQTQEARLFAMLTFAGADSLINCWDDKAYWSWWRPSTAIAEAATDGNPATEADSTWQPLLPNPPYPDQPSGYNCFTSGTFHAAQDFFGTDKMAFSLRSDSTSAGGVGVQTRDYDRFSRVFKDTIDARVYLGIHFRTPDVAGFVMGKKVAQWESKHFFQPVN